MQQAVAERGEIETESKSGHENGSGNYCRHEKRRATPWRMWVSAFADPFQGDTELARGLITLRLILFQRLHDDTFKHRRDPTVARTRRIRRLVEDGADQLRAL